MIFKIEEFKNYDGQIVCDNCLCELVKKPGSKDVYYCPNEVCLDDRDYDKNGEAIE